jgi:hypothetical protein
MTKDELKGKAESHSVDTPPFKITSDGRKVLTDETGKQLQKRKDWIPQEVPREWWRRAPELHDIWRAMYPDGRKEPEPSPAPTGATSKKGTKGSSSSKKDAVEVQDPGGGIAEGHLSEPDTSHSDIPVEDYWEETAADWILWRVKAKIGVTHPYTTSIKDGPPQGVLQGSRRTEATMTTGEIIEIIDVFDTKRSYQNKDDWSRLHREKWTGPMVFPKDVKA